MRVPTYRKHKATGGAWIEANGCLIYLGSYGTEAARARYFQELATWAKAKGTPAAIDAYVAEVKKWADEGSAAGQARYVEALAARADSSGNAADAAAYLAELAKAADRAGTPEAKQKWRDEAARLAAGGQRAALPDVVTTLSGEPLLVKHLILEYWRRRVKEHYRKRGQLTSEARNIRTSLKLLRRMYGNLPAAAFDQLKLEQFRDSLIDGRGNAVKTINTRVRQVRQMFRWGAQKKLVTSAVWADLQTLENLTEGRTRAKSGVEVPPVPDKIVEQTLPFLSPIVADILRFIRMTGCRSGEPLELRPRDLVRHPEVDVWFFRPEGHKSEHKGVERRVYIGPKAQAVLMPYLAGEPDAFCFAHSDGKPYTQQAVARCLKRALCKLAKSLGHELPKRPKKASPSWTPKREWFESVGAPYWHLHQLRHTAAEEAESSIDIDGACAVLGHTDSRTTERYLRKAAKQERKFAKAAEVAKQIG